MGSPVRETTRGEVREETETGEAKQACPECVTASLVMDSEGRELRCEDCGLVIEEDMIDRGAEWRAFTAQERESKSRVGRTDDTDNA